MPGTVGERQEGPVWPVAAVADTVIFSTPLTNLLAIRLVEPVNVCLPVNELDEENVVSVSDLT